MKKQKRKGSVFTALNTVFNIYLSYPINRDDETNFYRLLQNYTNIGTEIYAYLIDWEKMDGLPRFRLYVPADHELFIHNAYKSGFLTKEQINSINYNIIEKCDLLIYFSCGFSCGHGTPIFYNVIKEIEYAKQKGVAVYTMPDLSSTAIQALKLAIKLIIRAED